MSQWYVNDSGREVGPLSSADLRRMAREGRIRPDTWLRQVGQGGWIPASRVKGLFDTPAMGDLPPAYGAPPPAYGSPPSPVTHIPPGPMMPAGQVGFNQPGFGQQIQPAYGQQPPAAPPPPPRRNKPATSGFPVVFIIAGGVAVAVFALVAVGVGLWAFASSGKRADKILQDDEIYEARKHSICTIKGKVGGGSGFLVRPGLVATNYHVINMEFVDNLKIEFPVAPGRHRRARVRRVIYGDTHRDLALLKVESELEALPLSEKSHLRPGKKITIIGNPGFGDSIALTSGHFSSETTLDSKVWYQLNAGINPGNSGSPVFDDRGKVIGIATAKLRGKEALAFCIPVSDLNAALEEVANYTSREEIRGDARHRARTTVRLLEFVCSKYDEGLRRCVAEMDRARLQKVNINDGIRKAQNDIGMSVSLYNSVLTVDVKPNINRLGNAEALDANTREKLIDLWATYIEMQDYFNRPRGTSESFRNKQIELGDRYRSQSTKLKALLGVS